MSKDTIRIIAGEFRSRRLQTPPGRSRTRPTANRVRESICNMLDDWIDGGMVLDAFGGTGSLGLEAISRGATHLHICEPDRTMRSTLLENIDTLGVRERVTLWRVKLQAAIKALIRDEVKFDVMLLDPPFIPRFYKILLEELPLHQLLAEDGRISLQFPTTMNLEIPEGPLVALDRRKYGSVSLYLLGGASQEDA